MTTSNGTTTKWRALIADDEPAARRGVRQLLTAFPEFEVAGECRNGAEVLAALDVSSPDVVFLDIQMPGVDGFEVIRRRSPERMPAVVFLTAFDQFAIKAFEAEALDYLVKPVTEARFAATMKRLERRLSSSLRSIARDDRIVVTTSRGAAVLHLSEIDWIEAAGNYAQLWIGRRNYFLRESLQLLEERVSKHGFARAHRRALIRLSAIKELVRPHAGTRAGALIAILDTGARIPISRRRAASFTAAVRDLSINSTEE
ncbi:MAG TPA: response regulator [Pyrinomonadaceae bacterium]|nr:response regulator [Pyrinomonadaceae bacterium]